MRTILTISFSIFLVAFVQAQTTTIYFDSNKSTLKSEAIRTLDSLGLFLKDKRCWQVDVEGFCDNTGTNAINQPLSDKRADVVYQYIGSHFKNPIRGLSAKGNSSSAPVGDNATETGKARNRRVEITYKLEEIEKVIVEKTPEPELPKEETLLATPGTLNEQMKPEDLQAGKLLVMKNLNFVGGTSQLLKESEPSLKLLLKLMKENPKLEIEIEGHVCCANDMQLSVERALAVLEFLTNNGISEKRLKYKGHSWNKPVASDATEQGRISNRRVEILILKN